MVRVSPTALLCVVCITQTCLSYHELLSLLWTVRQAGFSSSCADVLCMKVLMARCVTGCHGNTWVHYRGWTWFPAQNTFLGNSHEQVRQWLLWYVLLSEFCVWSLVYEKGDKHVVCSLSPKALDRVNHAFLFTQFILVARRLVDPFPCPKRASWYSFLSERITLLYFRTILLHFC